MAAPRQVDDTVPRKLRQAIVEVLGVDETAIERSARLVEDLGADSLDIADLGIALEELYRVEISDESLEGLEGATVADVIALLERHKVKLTL